MTVLDIISKSALEIFTKIKARLDNSVTGVKGDKESAYRTGLVNLTPANIGAVPSSAVGAANGVAELDSAGKVPSAQLPSYVDDVLEYASLSAFPATGESGKIYVAADTNLSYRWSGSAYVEISPSLALGETSSTAYRGDRGKAAYDHAQATGNAHGMTKTDIGLGNVDNTSDANKPISAATQAELNNKVDKIVGKGLSTNDFTTKEKNSLAAIKALLQNAALDRTASGNPATFSDGKAADLKALTVTIAPTQSGSGDPSPSNVRPISGATSVSVTRSGKNLLPFHKFQTSGENAVYLAESRNFNDALTLPAGTYTLSYGTTGDDKGPFGIFWRHSADSSSWTSAASALGTDFSATVTLAKTEKVMFQLYRGGKKVPIDNIVWTQLEIGETPSDYVSYQGQNVTVTLTDGANPLTVYGGTLDAAAGRLSVTWANIASYNGETLPGRWMSDRDAYAPGTSPTAGAQVVYELAAPVAYTLAPAQLAALAGYNSVFADAGTLSVTYLSNPAIALGGST